MIIAISGTPGTGKTYYAKRLARKNNLLYIDVTKLIISEKLYDGFDKKDKTYDVDINKLNKRLIQIIKEYKQHKQKIKKTIKTNIRANLTKKDGNFKTGIIFDSHLSHFLEKKYIDLCIITRCKLKTLANRLKQRGYSANKISDNLEAEIFEMCLQEAIKNGHKVKVVWTDKKKSN
jgi:adenylate kinase